ncbi:hypothetical protein MMC16_000177 [Acarospora aff. strigata]|nr:hypothetical protein [Acarospora aff. strigata]
MNQLPLGLPRDYREVVAQLSADPLHGGPPASGIGLPPDACQYSPLASYPPNFEGWDPRDNLPCHISQRATARLYKQKLEQEGQPGGPHDLVAAEEDLNKFNLMNRLHFYGSQQPLTVRPLPDGSNIYAAPEGSVEEGFADAWTWYKRWLEFLHFEWHDFARIKRLAALSQTVKQWKVAQQLFPPAEPSAVNGLYAVPPPLQEWLWPWHFWSVWQIRRDLRSVPDPHGVPFSIDLLDDCLDAEFFLEDYLDSKFWVEDQFGPFQITHRIGDIPDDRDLTATFREVYDCVTAQRQYFKTRALRYYALKRPWKKMWLVMGTEPVPQGMVNDVLELQALLHEDVYGSQLLSVHPILPHQLREKTDGCIISGSDHCGGPWKAGHWAVETWCGHIACIECTHTHWEGFTARLRAGEIEHPVPFGDWPCVTCRTSGGRLRDKMEFAQTHEVGEAADAIADANVTDMTIEPIPHRQ